MLADLHAVDPEAVGLGDFGKPTGYLERQVRRWGSQWELVKRDNDPFDADVRRLHSALAEAIPPQSRTSIVHGDYRIDNTMLDADDATKVRRGAGLGDVHARRPDQRRRADVRVPPSDVQHDPRELGVGVDR